LSDTATTQQQDAQPFGIGATLSLRLTAGQIKDYDASIQTIEADIA